MGYGRYFEEFTTGEVIKHWPGRTITETDCTWFALLTMNQHPLHSDAHYAEKHTQHGQRVVLGPLVFSIGIGMTVADISGRAIANLEVNALKHEKPTFIGDTLYARTRVQELRESSQGDRGIVTVANYGFEVVTADEQVKVASKHLRKSYRSRRRSQEWLDGTDDRELSPAAKLRHEQLLEQNQRIAEVYRRQRIEERRLERVLHPKPELTDEERDRKDLKIADLRQRLEERRKETG